MANTQQSEPYDINGSPKFDVDPIHEYDSEIAALKRTNPNDAETVFNVVLNRIINNLDAVRRAVDEKSELTDAAADGGIYARQNNDWVDMSGTIDDLSNLTFQLAVQGLINTDGMKHVVVDDIETASDVIIISGIFDNGKVYI